MRMTILSGLLLPVLAVPMPVLAQDDIREERVQFEPGAVSATVESSIKGYETVDYVLGAAEGQYANVSMATDNTANYFNILPPGSDGEAIFIGSTQGNQYEGALPASGDYKVRVYLMRSAARREEVANYRLEMIIAASDAGSGQQSSASDGAQAPISYDATGAVPCAMGAGQPTGYCGFGVIREGDGAGTVTIVKPDDSERVIFFEAGEAVGSDASEADGGAFGAERQGDTSIVTIGEERYEIPDAVIYGG